MAENATYDVVLLVEQTLSEEDARQVTDLHDELRDEGESVTYHVLMPVEDAAARVEAALGSLAAGEALASPALVMNEVDLAKVREECLDRSRKALEVTISRLRAAGGEVDGEVVHEHPVEALCSSVGKYDGREVIVLTRPHVVAEFFHVDWTSRVRRKLGVPVLHLLEHETLDEQAGGGEGITGV